MKRKKIITVDENGIEYVFSSDKFQSAVKAIVEKAKAKKEARLSQAKMFDLIGQDTDSSPETIRNWFFGKNSPMDYEMVQRIASSLHVEVSELLEPVDASKGVGFWRTLANDKKLIEEVFQKNLTVLSERAIRVAEISQGRQHSTPEIDATAIQRLREIHLYINCFSLTTSNNVRNLLHRIILESEDILSNHTPDIFCKYFYELTFQMESFYGCSRDAILHCGDTEDIDRYLNDEIEFASDFQLEGVRNFDENYDKIEIFNKEDFAKHGYNWEEYYKYVADKYYNEVNVYGYHGNLEITPTMVYIHKLTQWMSDLYKKVFEGYFE